MTHEDFMHMSDEFLADVFDRLRTKGKLYAPGTDRLSQFKDMSGFTHLSPYMNIYVLVSKHFEALGNIDVSATSELIDELTGDIICYMLLTRALFSDLRSAS